MQRIFVVIYRILYSLVLVATCLYAVGFIGNLIVPKSIDSGIRGPLTKSLSIDLGLLAMFTILHTITRTHWFRRLWGRFVPDAIEHSTYVLFSCLALLVLFRHWRPIPEVIWNIENSDIRSFVWILFGLGWVAAVLGTWVANKPDLLWLRPQHIVVPGLIVASWATPRMTLGHLLFAGVATSWVVLSCRARKPRNDDAFGYGNQPVAVP